MPGGQCGTYSARLWLTDHGGMRLDGRIREVYFGARIILGLTGYGRQAIELANHQNTEGGKGGLRGTSTICRFRMQLRKNVLEASKQEPDR